MEEIAEAQTARDAVIHALPSLNWPDGTPDLLSSTVLPVQNQTLVLCPGGSHEGCHNYADMPTYLTHILALISPMFDELYGVANRPSNFYYIAADQAGPTACHASDGNIAAYDHLSYMYCGGDQAIHTGQDSLWLFYSEIGDAAPAVGYAHEWGHHIQNIMGVPQGTTPQESIQRENQADCIAGVWVYFAQQSGFLEFPTIWVTFSDFYRRSLRRNLK